MTAAPISLPKDMLEDAWTRWVIDVAKLHGWRVHHARPALRQSGRWSTPVQGHTGAPDLLLARRGVLLLAELKTNRGRLRPEQRDWLDHLGSYGVVWRPRDAETVLHRLAHPHSTGETT